MSTKNQKVQNFGIAVLILFIISALFAFPVLAQTTPIDFTGFDGSGFASIPSAGQLDSDIWYVTGLSDGGGAFGGTYTSGDFAKGTDPDTPHNGVGTGGIYAFDVDDSGAEDMILGVQPGGSDFTPGSITLKVENTTGSTVSDVYIAYEIWTYNDQSRANSLNFSYRLSCTDGMGVFTDIASLNYTTTEAADVSPSWSRVSRATTITGANLADGSSICLRWTGDDVSGTDYRDEYGIDDIEVRSGGPTAISLTSFIAASPQSTWLPLTLLASGIIFGGFTLRRRKREN